MHGIATGWAGRPEATMSDATATAAPSPSARHGASPASPASPAGAQEAATAGCPFHAGRAAPT